MKKRYYFLFLLITVFLVLGAVILDYEVAFLPSKKNNDLIFKKSDEVKINALEVCFDFREERYFQKRMIGNLSLNYYIKFEAPEIEVFLPFEGYLKSTEELNAIEDKELRINSNGKNLTYEIVCFKEISQTNLKLEKCYIEDILDQEIKIEDLNLTYYEFSSQEDIEVRVKNPKGILYNGFDRDSKNNEIKLVSNHQKQRCQLIVMANEDISIVGNYKRKDISLIDLSHLLAWQLAVDAEMEAKLSGLVQQRLMDVMSGNKIEDMNLEYLLSDLRYFFVKFVISSPELSISYLTYSSFDESYAPNLFDFGFLYNSYNLYETGDYQLIVYPSEKNKEVQYCILDLKKEGEKYYYKSENLLKEIKVYMAKEKEANKTIQGISKNLSLFIYMVLLPALAIVVIVMGILCKIKRE